LKRIFEAAERITRLDLPREALDPAGRARGNGERIHSVNTSSATRTSTACGRPQNVG
jgi:hypothetical protein